MLRFKAKELTGFWEKAKGLIGADPITPIFFKTRWGIHTFGMKQPIDVVILDEDMMVVRLTRSLPPNSIFLWNPRYRNVLELPDGTIMKNRIVIGNEI